MKQNIGNHSNRVRFKYTRHDIILFVYLFLNPVFLPFGLFYAHIYAPIAYYYIARWSKPANTFIGLLIVIVAILTALTALSSFEQIRYFDYLSSTLILFASIIFAIYIYVYIAVYLSNFESLVDKVIKVNVYLTFFAILLLLSGIQEPLWIQQEGQTIRLQFFAYEPSIYALSFAPFLIYAIVRYIEKRQSKDLYLLAMAAFPIALSGSAGVMGATALALVFANFKATLRLLAKKWIIVLIGSIAFISIFPKTIERFQAILDGNDYSGSVRIVFSMQAAINMLDEKGIWLLGTGLGQLKFQIEKYTSEFDAFGGTLLPNSIANTVASIGIIGLGIKLGLVVWLHLKTKAYKYQYSNVLFLFVFIYQFTGGFLSNVNEYVAIAIAFAYARYNQRKHLF